KHASITRDCPEPTRCSTAGLALIDGTRTLNLVNAIGGGVGIAGVASGVTLGLVGRSREPKGAGTTGRPPRRRRAVGQRPLLPSPPAPAARGSGAAARAPPATRGARRPAPPARPPTRPCPRASPSRRRGPRAQPSYARRRGRSARPSPTRWPAASPT